MCENLIFMVAGGDYIERHSFNAIFLIVIIIDENVSCVFVARITIPLITVSLRQKKKPARSGQGMFACV